MKPIPFLVAIGLYAAIPSAYGLSYSFQPNHGQVSFVAKGKPAMIKIKGTGQGVTGSLIEKDRLLSGTLTFDLNTLNTEIDLRDEHMKNKYLEVQKFPQARLHLKNLKIPQNQSGTIDFSGEMEIKGVTKPVQGQVTLLPNTDPKSPNQVQIQAELPLKLSNYPNIGVPSYMGITVAEEVNITVRSEVIRN